MKTGIVLAAILASLPLTAVPEVIRSVDKDGNVTFSDQPVPGSVESTPVIIDAPQPSKQEVEENRRTAQETIRRAEQNQVGRDNSSNDKTARIQAAQTELDNATAWLREAQVVHAQDRQSLANGRSKLRPEYLQRVQDAELQVMEAQKKLNAAKLGR